LSLIGKGDWAPTWQDELLAEAQALDIAIGVTHLRVSAHAEPSLTVLQGTAHCTGLGT